MQQVIVPFNMPALNDQIRGETSSCYSAAMLAARAFRAISHHYSLCLDDEVSDIFRVLSTEM